MLNVIEKENKKFVSVKDLYNGLLLSTSQYSRWVKTHIIESKSDSKNYIKTLDSNLENKRGNFSEDYLIEVHFAAYIVGITTSKAKHIVFDFLENIIGNAIALKPNKKEHIFEKMLFDFFGEENVVCEKLVLNGKYRIDFVILNEVIVEYDEKYHLSKNQKAKDKDRIYEMNSLYKEKWKDDNVELNIVRVNEGGEVLGLRMILDSYNIVKNQIGDFNERNSLFGYKGDVDIIFD